jgi:hypothetical protein
VPGQARPAAAATPLPPVIRIRPRAAQARSSLGWLSRSAAAAVLLLGAGVGSFVALARLDGLDISFLTQPFSAPATEVRPGPNPGPAPSHPDESIIDEVPRLTENSMPGPLIHESLAMQPYGPLLPEMKTQSDLDHFMTTLRPKPQPFVSVRPNLMTILPVRDIDQPGLGKEFLLDTAQALSTRIDLFTTDPARALDRLQAAFHSAGASLQISPDLKARLGRHPRPTFTVYSEDMTGDEIVRALRYLAAEDRKPNAALFDKLTANPCSSGELARLLGSEPASWQPTLRGPLGVDLTRPLSDQTAQQIANHLEGQGKDRADAERRAVAILYNSPQPLVPREIKQLLDSRKEWRNGRAQVVFVVWPL